VNKDRQLYVPLLSVNKKINNSIQNDKICVKMNIGDLYYQYFCKTFSLMKTCFTEVFMHEFFSGLTAIVIGQFR